MAFSQESTTSSGYGSSQTSQTTPKLNSNYLCYWLTSCDGQHELNACPKWKDELHGKLGIYYSSSGTYKLFIRDQISKRNLEYNRSGCTKVHLLVYNYDQQEILFGLKRCKERKNDEKNHLLLAFPSAQPYQRNENMLEIPRRAFQWLTTDINFASQCLEQGLKNRFLFQNANVIYPVHLTGEKASKLTKMFVPNEEFKSLHWFSLSEVLSQLPSWLNYIKYEETENELAQIDRIEPVGIELGKYQLWYLIATCLMCIREHVPGGFETFLKV